MVQRFERFEHVYTVHCSGLDSTTAMHLLTSLRQLAKGGRSIITTIHQPSSRLYQQLDKLLLLSQVSLPSAAQQCH